ncbi:uncharacterized protein SAPINGB_P002827 [Magnusiomyces paraingens]|uniref:Protein SYM1 n=1 Tax=Magnusiomyces paraingens TaxID=2606893 RepID=A0A5E8BLU4_9ASCO|nr:uncharacterized protein SAPINGB_P002827 [Saprochaete ingens]VVT50628.1 unnamed protein product [Saprochaete ingens]
MVKILFGTGDLVAQAITNSHKEQPPLAEEDGSIISSGKTGLNIDWVRTAKSVIYGSCIFGPVGTYYYPAIDRIPFPKILQSLGLVSSTKPLTSKGAQFATQVVPKVLFDQLLFSPCAIAVYYIVMGVFDGMRSWTDIVNERLIPNWANTFETNLVVWPTVQFLNFGFIPTNYRLVMVNVVSVGWNAFISFRNNNSKELMVQKD